MKGIIENMNKTELVKEISNQTTLSQKDVAIVIDAFQNVVKDTVVNGDKVALTGFLTFDKKHVDAKFCYTRLSIYMLLIKC